jgi:hypothetical protein
MTDLKPADLVLPISMIIRDHPSEWLTPHDIWRELRRLAPEVAARVSEKVQTYKDPERNSEVWFVSNTLSHLVRDSDEFELTDVDHVPEMKGRALWEIIRKRR